MANCGCKDSCSCIIRPGSDNVTVTGAGTVGAPYFIYVDDVVASGSAVLVAGTVTVLSSLVQTTSRIRLSYQQIGGTPGAVFINGRTASTSFVIKSTSASDTSTIFWELLG